VGMRLASAREVIADLNSISSCRLSNNRAASIPGAALLLCPAGLEERHPRATLNLQTDPHSGCLGLTDTTPTTRNPTPC
jgi:hypothetical protein